MLDMWISFGEGFLLVFAINDKESFNLLKSKHDRVLKGKHGIKCLWYSFYKYPGFIIIVSI